jgi:hypothetical protein
MKSSWMTEQQGKSEGGKKPPSRSINQFFELCKSSKNCRSGAKILFRHAAAPAGMPGFLHGFACFSQKGIGNTPKVCYD